MNEQLPDDLEIQWLVAEVWSQLEPAAAGYLAEPRRRARARHRRRVVGLAVSALAVGVGTSAAAARVLIGRPAPPAVERSLADVDDGMPADLRLNPDATHARSVAEDGEATLYAADLPDGGVCTEIAIAGRPMGAVCRPGSQPRASIEATIPGVPERPSGSVVVAGRINRPADAAHLVTSTGTEVALTIQPDGFFIIELSAADSLAARPGLRIESEQAGRPVASKDLSDAFALDSGSLEPISVEMVSGPGDLTQVLSFTGVVRVPGAVSIRLVYPDGAHADVAIGNDGHYEILLATDRRGALARSPGRLVALAGDNTELASRTVAAVSYWHASTGSRP